MIEFALSTALGYAAAVASHGSAARFVVLPDLSSFTRKEQVYETVVSPGVLWTELVPSWNATTPEGASLRFEVSVKREDRWTKFYNLGDWSQTKRQSVNGQKDADGDVLTDTLRLTAQADEMKVRVTLLGDVKVKFLGLSLANPAVALTRLEANREAWGKTLSVPERAQGSYPNGSKICSPTCVSMIVSHWAGRLGRPEMDMDVPEVCEAIFDPNWPGTGNWPFNAAYAGSYEGMRGLVARLTDIRELEDWIAAGVPVATSIAYDILRYGERRRGNDGHLIVLIGFTATGDPIFNDPAKSDQVQQVYPREMFWKAWSESNRTVYLIFPESYKTPKSEFRHWPEPE